MVRLTVSCLRTVPGFDGGGVGTGTLRGVGVGATDCVPTGPGTGVDTWTQNVWRASVHGRSVVLWSKLNDYRVL